MNDLAEKALHGLAVARREVCARPMLSLGVVGCALGCLVVVAGGRASATRASRPPTSWLGLQDVHARPAGDWLPAAILALAIAALALLWVVAHEVVRRTAQPAVRVWTTAAAWALPFLLGPPLLDTTVYSYAAFGLLQRHGLNPYAGGADRLGEVPVVSAIDPSARGTASSAGPLGTELQHLAVSVGAGHTLAGVLILRAIAVLATIAIGRFAAELAGPHRTSALTLTVLNPLVLLYFVSAAHLDAVLIALVLAALVAATRRRWLWSVTLAALAGSVSGQGFLVLPCIVAVHWTGRRTMPSWRLLGRDVVVAGAVIAAVGFAVPDGFGWLNTVDDQFSAHTPFSVSGAVSGLIDPIVRGASYDDLAAGARITALAALVCVLGYLLATVRRRSLDRTAGYSLLALGLLAPVLNPWYLLWGTLCLAPRATGAVRVAVISLCAAGCLLAPAGFTDTAGNAVTGGWLVAVAAVVVVVAARQRRTAAPEVSEPVQAPVGAAG